MKNWFVALMMFAALGMTSLCLAAAEQGKIPVKTGDSLNVCGCGTGCPCGTLSRKAGTCACGKNLVKAKVTRVEEGRIYVMIDGKERAFNAAGKFQCACGPGCNCDTISQKPGKCGCGRALEEVK